MSIRTTIDYWKWWYKKYSSPYTAALNRYLKYYEQLPIQEKTILLEAQHGTAADGNMFYFAQYLSHNSEYADYKVYFSATAGVRKTVEEKLAAHGLDDILVVGHGTDEYYRLLASAKYFIINNSMNIHYIKKEGQVIMNTWHGTPLKYLGRKSQADFNGIGNAQKGFAIADFLLCPNEHTKEAIIRDYMLENISCGQTLMLGYPRNQPFFDKQRQEQIRQEQELQGKKVYAFMPTFRGGASGNATRIGNVKNDAYLNYYLYELDKRLQDDEILFVNLHPVTKKSIDIQSFQHLRPFPAQYETYEFLSVADCLITDYSSVFFDFACTGRKIVLFTYDLEEYIRDRGMYLDIQELPFPKVRDHIQLLQELRSPKNYEDADFRATYCPWDGPDVTEKLCKLIFAGDPGDIRMEKIPDNGKENVLLYAGNFAPNGVTASLKNLVSTLDLDQRNYFLVYENQRAKPYKDNMPAVIGGANYLSKVGEINLSVGALIIRKLFNMKLLPAGLYSRWMAKCWKLEMRRIFGEMRIDHAVHFTGYESENILQWTQLDCEKVIYVHSDMEKEIEIRGNQRRDVLSYAYKTYDRVAIVTEDLRESTRRIKGGPGSIVVCHNLIDYKNVLEKAGADVDYGQIQECTHTQAQLAEILAGEDPIFISNGRFSPEKNHAMLVRAFKRILENDNPRAKLILMGGSQFQDYYARTRRVVEELGLEQSVVMIMSTPNPFAILSRSHYFVLSSQYEGFGLVLAEADILGKPVISTDITGPRIFMKTYGGTLVENSEEGVYRGMQQLLQGKVKPMGVDYAAYNRTAIEEFERLLTE